MKSANEITASDKVPEGWSPLLELAAREVFEIMLGCKLETQTAPAPVSGDFTAMVGLAGQVCGLLTLHCSAHSAALMASRMLGAEVKESDPQMWDAIGEIANMIAGNFKNKLTGMGDRCVLSVPTVIIGRDFALFSLAKGEHYEVTFLFEDKPFCVTLDLHG